MLENENNGIYRETTGSTPDSGEMPGTTGTPYTESTPYTAAQPVTDNAVETDGTLYAESIPETTGSYDQDPAPQTDNYYSTGNTGSSEYHYARPDAGRSFDSASEVNSAYNRYTYNNPYISADAPVYSHDFTQEKPKPVKKRRQLGRGWLIALCIILSIASGFGGAWTYSKFFGKNQVIITTVNNDPGTSSTAMPDEYDFTTIVAKAKESVVEITTEIVKTGSFFSQSIATGAGSGVVIDSDGYIATNYHVIQGASSVTVTLPDGSVYPAKVYGYDTDNDVAVVKIDAHDLPVVVFADSTKLKVGEKVFAIGNPLGSLGGTVTDGIVSALDRDITVEGQRMTLLQTSAAVNHGNSGGGLFNSKGELIGIVNAKSAGEDVEGLGFAIPSNVVRDVITNILNNGGSIVSSTPVMGITVTEIYDEATLKEYNLTRYGVYILNVEEGYGAAQAGLKVYDCIVSVDNIAISRVDDLTNLLKTHEAGDVVSVQVIRGNRLMTFDVKLKLRDQA